MPPIHPKLTISGLGEKHRIFRQRRIRCFGGGGWEGRRTIGDGPRVRRVAYECARRRRHLFRPEGGSASALPALSRSLARLSRRARTSAAVPNAVA